MKLLTEGSKYEDEAAFLLPGDLTEITLTQIARDVGAAVGRFPGFVNVGNLLG